jgi:GTP-binding protein
MIVSAEFVTSSVDWTKCPKPIYWEVAFIGRSNVGKSSLINRLVNKKGLAKTSGKPGKTQTINHFIINEQIHKTWYLVDLPGYGYAKVSKTSRDKWEKFIADYLQNRETIYCTMILIDSRHEPQKIDVEFVNQMGQWGLPFAIVFTKADKPKPGALNNNIEAFKNALLETFTELPNIFITSAENGLGKDELLSFLLDVPKHKLPGEF